MIHENIELYAFPPLFYFPFFSCFFFLSPLFFVCFVGFSFLQVHDSLFRLSHFVSLHFSTSLLFFEGHFQPKLIRFILLWVAVRGAPSVVCNAWLSTQCLAHRGAPYPTAGCSKASLVVLQGEHTEPRRHMKETVVRPSCIYYSWNRGGCVS